MLEAAGAIRTRLWESVAQSQIQRSISCSSSFLNRSNLCHRYPFVQLCTPSSTGSTIIAPEADGPTGSEEVEYAALTMHAHHNCAGIGPPQEE